jgi:hypothetical protein
MALIALGLFLALGAIQFFKDMKAINSADDAALQKVEESLSDANAVTPRQPSVVAGTPAPAVVNTTDKATDNTTDNQPSTTEQQMAESSSAKPAEKKQAPRPDKTIAVANPAEQKGRSLPAGIEVKFDAGDLIVRITGLRLGDESADDAQLTASVRVKNLSSSSHGFYYSDAFRLLINDGRHSPTKAPPPISIPSDSETSGDVIFGVPKSASKVSLRISFGDEHTIIPVDLRSGASRLDVQPAGIPRTLPKIARMDVHNGSATYDFRAVTLEPYTAESFILRFSMRILTNNRSLAFYGKDFFRLVFDDIPHPPVRGPTQSIQSDSALDTDIVFIVPKSVTKAMLRVKDENNWRTVPIDLKAGKS